MAKLYAALLVALIVAITDARDLSGCSVRCNTYVNDPVCGFNGKDYKSFQNNCLMLTANCGAEDVWEQQPLSNCDTIDNRNKRSIECPNVCPMNYAPICATDGRTNRVFSNQCALKVANCNTQRWMTTRSSACGDEAMFGVVEVGGNDENNFNCPEKCDYKALYVCGFNGVQYRIFGNECTFQLTKCRTKQSWKLRPISECDQRDDWYFPSV